MSKKIFIFVKSLWFFYAIMALWLSAGLASAQVSTVNMSKDLCDGPSSSGGECTSLPTVTIGQPVYYEITIGNTLNSPAPISLQEDLPSGFVPANFTAPMICEDSSGNSLTVTTTQTSPYILNLTLPASETVTCRIGGFFSVPGEIATNMITETGGLSNPADVTTVVSGDANIPVDLSVTKTANTSGPLDLSAGPQTVNYTIALTTDRDVYLDDYLTFYDTVGLFNDSIPIDAQLNPGSVSCSGCGALAGPIGSEYSHYVNHEAWGAFASFDYGAPDPILFKAGDTLTLTYSITYSIHEDQACIVNEFSNGMNNRVFLGLANDSMSLADINSANNDSANVSNVPVSFDIDLPVDTDCISSSSTPTKPSPLIVSKSYVDHLTAGGTNVTAFPVPWDQDYVTYSISMTNGSADEVVYDIDVTDVYSNLTYTPNHEVQLYDVSITYCPASSVCTITSPNTLNPAPQGSVSAINSYYASAGQFKGKVDVLNPGETVTYQVRIRLRNPSCDFAPLQQPKTVRNSVTAQHMIDRPDEFDPLVMVPGSYVKGGSADIQVEATPPCDFTVNKTVTTTPNAIEFGDPMTYTLEFQNGAAPVQAGTLLDVLRIEQNYYALNMDVAYSFTCNASPLGGVTNFLPAGSGTGKVSYVDAPHRGLRVMDHSGFVNFAPNAKLTCDISVTIEKPLDSDPYCFSNGTPTIGNAAIIDGSLYYNANQAWPLAPQNTTWDAVSSELEKCYHLVVNKAVSPLTTTPNFGPDLTYTVTVTNASGSGSAGDINFPPGSAPWRGPVVTDTFQPTAFPVALPQNTPVPVLNPCDISGVDPCDWLAPLSVSGHEVGIGNVTYSYSIPSSYTPHEICNDLSADFLIDGAVPDRWYQKAQSVMEDKDVCALIRTNLEITKTVDVHPTLNLPSSASFIVDINCTPPNGFTNTLMSQTLTMGSPVQTQKNIIVGSQCQIVERTPDESLLPSHCDWLPPTYPDGDSFTADGSVEPHTISVHNATVCRFGDVKINKIDTGDSQPPQGTLFDFGLDCDTPASQIYTASAQAGGDDTILQIPDGSSCALTETAPETFMDDLGRTCTWDTPSFSPSDTAIVDEDNVQNVTVNNPVTCKFLADLTIRKAVALTGDMPSFDADTLYSASVSCVNPVTNQSVYNGTVGVSQNTPNVIEDIVTPAVCTVTEDLANAPLPQYCTGWGTPIYQPDQSVTLAAQPGSSATVTMVNHPICPPRGTLFVEKTLSLASAPVLAGTQYSYDKTCTADDGTVTTTSHTIRQLPLGRPYLYEWLGAGHANA